MEPIKTSADRRTLNVTVRGRFDMSLVFDLWQTCQLEQGRYHTYIFDLARVGELRDSGLAWLMMFQRWATKAKIGVRLMNCRPEITERCASAGLEMEAAAPLVSVDDAGYIEPFGDLRTQTSTENTDLLSKSQADVHMSRYGSIHYIWFTNPRSVFTTRG